MKEQGNRLREIRLFLSRTQKQFSEELGIKQSAYSLMENGINNITPQTIKLLELSFNINPNFIETGTIPMFLIQVDDEIPNLKEEIVLLKNIIELKEKKIENLEQVIKQLKEKP